MLVRNEHGTLLGLQQSLMQSKVVRHENTIAVRLNGHLQTGVAQHFDQRSLQIGNNVTVANLRDEHLRIDKAHHTVQHIGQHIGMVERMFDEHVPQIEIVVVLAKVNRLVNVAHIIDNDGQGLDRVARSVQQIHHFRVEFVFATHVEHFFDVVVLGAAQKRQQFVTIVFGVQSDERRMVFAASIDFVQGIEILYGNH